MTDSNFVNRELSWLEFNQRVFEQSLKESTPLLERAKFLAIASSNLDEFFKVRVGSLKMLEKAGVQRQDNAGMTTSEQLDAIRARVREMLDVMQNCQQKILGPALAQHSISRLRIDELDEDQHRHIERRFNEEYLASLAPIHVNRTGCDEDFNSRFPLLSSSQLCLCVRLAADGEQVSLGTNESDDPGLGSHFAVIPLGPATERVVVLPSSEGYEFVLVEDVIREFAYRFFDGREVLECSPFRMTRNADHAVQDDGAVDLLSQMEEMLVSRKTSDCVRLELDDSASDAVAEFLLETIPAESSDLYRVKSPIDPSYLFAISSIRGYESLKDEPWPALTVPAFSGNEDIFSIIAAGDQMLFHPYQTYDPVIQFVEHAAADPQVISIKQTLYRTSRDSPIVSALSLAARSGKNVTVLVELKARFDEARNIEWARQLEQDGVNVIWGIKGLKTHSKICMVVRKESTGICSYVHFGTGNYNEATASIYSDISFFTADEQLGSDAISFFNAISGYSVPQAMKKLSMAPVGLRESILELIEIETANAESGIPAFFDAKINSLVDREIIEALYRASSAGVKIRLNVRGICCLRPGIPGRSENIRVISIVDRFLEHARIYHAYHDGDHRLFISSADLMERNLDKRVELLVPVERKLLKQRLLSSLDKYFADNVSAQEMNTDGSYSPVRAKKKEIRSQRAHYDEAHAISVASVTHSATLLEPLKPGM